MEKYTVLVHEQYTRDIYKQFKNPIALGIYDSKSDAENALCDLYGKERKAATDNVWNAYERSFADCFEGIASEDFISFRSKSTGNVCFLAKVIQIFVE